MRRVALAVLAIGVGCLVGLLFASNPATVHGQGNAVSIAAVSGVVDGQDVFGPYDLAKNWPANISTLPGNEQWTWGAGQVSTRRIRIGFNIVRLHFMIDCGAHRGVPSRREIFEICFFVFANGCKTTHLSRRSMAHLGQPRPWR